jgi:ATP-dependent Clp protease adaptor protein ClpS
MISDFEFAMTSEIDIEAETETEIEVKEPSLFQVIIWNDDYTPMDFVVGLLVLLFEKTQEEAVELMFKVHESGHAVAGVYTEEIAETKAFEGRQLAEKHGHPLQLTYEEVN